MKGAFLILTAALLASFVLPAQPKPEEAAGKSAQAWLALIDKGDYAGSWDEASSFFKKAVTKDQWAQAMNGVRAPLGAVASRKLKSAQQTTSLPGAPQGQYVVMQFDASFANKKAAVETVTFMLDQDGQWRAAGYFIA